MLQKKIILLSIFYIFSVFSWSAPLPDDIVDLLVDKSSLIEKIDSETINKIKSIANLSSFDTLTNQEVITQALQAKLTDKKNQSLLTLLIKNAKGDETYKQRISDFFNQKQNQTESNSQAKEADEKAQLKNKETLAEILGLNRKVGALTLANNKETPSTKQNDSTTEASGACAQPRSGSRSRSRARKPISVISWIYKDSEIDRRRESFKNYPFDHFSNWWSEDKEEEYIQAGWYRDKYYSYAGILHAGYWPVTIQPLQINLDFSQIYATLI